MNLPLLMLGGLALEVATGLSDRLGRTPLHPVRAFGALAGRVERSTNRAASSRLTRILLGDACTAALVFLAAAAGFVVQGALPCGWRGTAAGAILAASLLAARSLHGHVAAVASAYRNDGLSAARHRVGRIVGRHTDHMDEAAAARAAIESLAENASDGVLAPLFWGALFGLPGLAAYKAVNTLDSMIGHRSARYEAYGKVAARLDDAANWIPARLTALLIAAAAGQMPPVGRLRREAAAHRSPNAGWPEAAMAHALGIVLSGPRHYPEGPSDDPWLNAAGQPASMADIDRALGIYRRAVGLAAAGLLVAGLAVR
ncbi:adenosylcobinamide-phosphate synthase CbiB [Pacificimonas flava]|uniref:Cobalamin biosynthesis protein CobD n=1 Tax=Pacificimonas flava TaxID=1234595 RepID=M2SBX2_9SPHN|nr:adenosylcobinamide-phosphate synthase CbiB [Pacificimonas flava]EMD82840.1 Adenosylcobinamide-phosphate synthase [Pacificimonas flava]MBB5279455.1 adenosylcobinamide-phosphate synthase [Pacificimonas flava]